MSTDRREFIKYCAFLSIAGLGLSMIAPGCGSSHFVQASAENNILRIHKDEFVVHNKNKTSYRRHIITRQNDQSIPVIIYRRSDTEYTALLLQCTHQGNELNVHGDMLNCPAHGSEFNISGEVLQGPAESNLKTYKVTQDEKFIYLQLT